MPYGIIENCSITHSNCNILLPWIEDIDSIQYRLNNNCLHPGINLQCTSIYTPCNGVVIRVAKWDDYSKYVIVVQYSSSICLLFSNVDKPFVTEGQLITAGTNIGVCTDYVHFEFLTSEPSNVVWIVRIYTLQLYKNNPMQVFDGSIVFDNSITLEYDWPEKYFQESYPPGYIGGDG